MPAPDEHLPTLPVHTDDINITQRWQQGADPHDERLRAEGTKHWEGQGQLSATVHQRCPGAAEETTRSTT